MSALRQPVDLPRLDTWMAEHLPDHAGPLTLMQFEGGQSNPTYRVDTPQRAYVLRTKPRPKAELLPSAHAIEREYRVMQALASTAVPVPAVYALCEDESVIGRAFYLMEHLDGRIFDNLALPGMAPTQRTALYDEAARVMAQLHQVDPGPIGLSSRAPTDTFYARQIQRWTQQYRLSQTEDIASMDRLIDWLPTHIPASALSPTGIVHGDLKIQNLLFHPTQPRVLGVLDWELNTLGHPLADLSYQGLFWHIPHDNVLQGLEGLDLPALGIPDEASFLQRYAAYGGLAAGSDWPFYLVYNFFRLAGIMQGVMKRAQLGMAASAQALAYGQTTRMLADTGWRIASHGL